jgi:hypothetical protein
MPKKWFFLTIGLACIVFTGASQAAPYRVLTADKVGGDGGYDYVYADVPGRLLYIPRTGDQSRITVFNLDNLSPAGVIPDVKAHGVAVSAPSHHGFSSSRPVVMWDARTLEPIKTIAVDGNPDGILYDSFDNSVYIFSHQLPNVTKIDAESGSVKGTLDLGGAPEQAVSDGNGHLYVDLEDKDLIAKIDAATLTVSGQWSLQGKGGTCAGLAIDTKNQILFAACRNPQTMVILSTDGKILAVLPIGKGCDGAAFDERTREVFTAQRDGTLSVIREDSPTSFTLEQTVATVKNAKTLTLDSKRDRIFLIAAVPGPVPTKVVPPTFTILEVGRDGDNS